MLAPWKKNCDQPRQHIKKQRHYFANKGPSSQSYGFSSSQVWMWELNYKESWVPKNWCFWTVVLEKTLESPLACKEIIPVNFKGNQSWIFIGSSVHFSWSTVSNSLWSHGLQNTRPPCVSPNPRVYSNLCPLSWWCHLNRLILCCPLLLLPSIFPGIRIFSNQSVLLMRWPEYLEFQHQSFQWIFRTDFL